MSPDQAQTQLPQSGQPIGRVSWTKTKAKMSIRKTSRRTKVT